MQVIQGQRAKYQAAIRFPLGTVVICKCLVVSPLAALLVGCGKPPPITPADLVPVDLQSVSSWKPEFAGPPLGETVGAGGTIDGCIGYIDAVADLGDPAQTRLEGWAWDVAASEPFQSFVVTDGSGRIVGAGVTAVDRPDVMAAFADRVDVSLVGFVAFAAPDADGLSVYGVNLTNDTVCAVGTAG